MMRLTAFLFLLLPAAACAINDAPYTYTSFDVPGAAMTVGAGINASGQICGYYAQQIAGAYHAFLRDSSGALTTFDYPGAAMTAALGINDLGQIVGYWTSDITGNEEHIFLRDPMGNMTTLGVQRTPINAAFGIDNSGQIVANALVEPSPNYPVFMEASGAYTVIAVPGFSSVYVYALNNGGISVGEVYGDGGVALAFISTADGSGPTATFSFPGSTTATVARGVNDFNMIVGYYNLGYRGGQTGHGFIRDSNGNFETMDVPGSTYTGAFGINNLNQIAGSWDDPQGGEHGFLAEPSAMERHPSAAPGR